MAVSPAQSDLNSSRRDFASRRYKQDDDIAFMRIPACADEKLQAMKYSACSFPKRHIFSSNITPPSMVQSYATDDVDCNSEICSRKDAAIYTTQNNFVTTTPATENRTALGSVYGSADGCVLRILSRADSGFISPVFCKRTLCRCNDQDYLKDNSTKNSSNFSLNENIKRSLDNLKGFEDSYSPSISPDICKLRNFPHNNSETLLRDKTGQSFSRTQRERTYCRSHIVMPGSEVKAAEDEDSFSRHMTEDAPKVSAERKLTPNVSLSSSEDESANDADRINLEDPWVKSSVVTDIQTAQIHVATAPTEDGYLVSRDIAINTNNYATTEHPVAKGRLSSVDEIRVCNQEQEDLNSPKDRITTNRKGSSKFEIGERIRSDRELLSRPSWCDAKFALSRVEQGEAVGNRCALKFRAFLHLLLFRFGCFVQRRALIVCLLGILILGACAIGLKDAHMETDIQKLWVESGGVLEEELAYSKNAAKTNGFSKQSGSETASETAPETTSETTSDSGGFTFQMLIQTGEDVATSDSMLLHLKAVLTAIQLRVEMYNQSWSFSDLCFKYSIPDIGDESSGDFDIAAIVSRVIPCSLITPLDCFWEGSKLLGPDPPLSYRPYISDITWKNVNPEQLMSIISFFLPRQMLDKLNSYSNLMKMAGITTGYVKKFCLDPKDPECPSTALNYDSQKPPDIKSVLSEGCSSYASKLMQWPIDLIVGDIERANKSSKTITNAKGLQTLLQLMTASNLYEVHRNSIKTGKDWSIDRAGKILKEWQRSFVNKIYKIPTQKSPNPDVFHAFSVATAGDILQEFSNLSLPRVIGGYLLMIGYACLSLMRSRASRSQGAVGIVGVLLVALSVAAGLGICTVIGISFNAASTQVLPFLLLGLGVDDMFLMAHHFGEISLLSYIPIKERTGESLKRVGVSVFLTSIAILSGFLFSLIIPMPALRAFGLQAAIVTVFNMISVLVIFPAILSLDLERRKNNKLDILCCCDSSTTNDVIDLTKNRQNQPCSYVYVNPPSSYMAPGAGTTITMQHTVQAYTIPDVSNPTTQNENSMISNPQQQTFTTTPCDRPKTPPPAYTDDETNRSNHMTKRIPSRSKVAFVNEAMCVTPIVGNSTPATPGSVRISRREVGSNPPTNLTTPMASVRSSTHSLVPRKKRGQRGCCSSGSKCTSMSTFITTFRTHTISQLAERYYAPFLMKNPVRITVIILFCALLGLSIYGTTLVKDGLDFGDVLPRGTRERAAIVAQTTYFSFYDMTIVTKSFNYASSQRELYQLHKSVGDVSYVMRNTDGGLPKFWLEYMRDWLKDLQDAFDKDWRNGYVNASTWTPDASDETVLAYKLLLQTGREEQPINKGRIGCTPNVGVCEKINRVRLVSDNDLIPEDAFYIYLSVWVGNDPLSYAASRSGILPAPVSWNPPRSDGNLIIPRSQAITYAQMPFYLNGMKENQDFVNVIKWVRGICTSFAEKTEVDSYPNGYPFTFWQQYIDLRFWLFVSLGCVIASVFVVLSVILCNPWAAAIMALFLAMIVTELFGFMGAIKVKLSAVPAVILVASIGLGVEFTVHIVFAYITSCGSRKERVKHSIGHMLGPVVDGAISTLLGVIMLSGAEFDFIIMYFFYVLAALIALGVLNGLVLLPVLLSFIGPPPEVIPSDGGPHLRSTTPPSIPIEEETNHTCNLHPDQQQNFEANFSNNNSNRVNCQRYSRSWPTRYHAGGHYSSRDDMHSRVCCTHGCCHSKVRLGHLERGHYFSERHYSRNHAFPQDSGISWERHPYAISSTLDDGDSNRIFVYPHADYVVYSNNQSAPDKLERDHQHCETGPSLKRYNVMHGNNDNASMSSSQDNHSGSDSNEGRSKMATLTASSSLTVKVHSSGRQPVVAFVDPPITAPRAMQFHSNRPSCLPWNEESGSITVPDLASDGGRRFDISALSE